MKKTNKFLPKKYVEDNQYLQFKWLSVLSSNTDTEIVEGLRKFADSYQIWIKQLDAAGNSIDERILLNVRRTIRE